MLEYYIYYSPSTYSTPHYHRILLSEVIKQMTTNIYAMKPRTFYFHDTEFPCDYIPSKPYIPFDWDNIRASKNETLKETLNDFRKIYIKTLILQTCNNEAHCELVPVGSYPNSVTSDADFNIATGDIIKIMDKITQNHHRVFTTTLASTFDMNVYGSISDIFLSYNTHCSLENICSSMDKTTIYQQHIWAFMKVPEYITTNKLHVLKYFSPTHLELFHRGQEQIAHLKLAHQENPFELHKRYLNKYLDDTTKLDPKDPNYNSRLNKLANIFSLAKYYERETYNSVGAVLHIVNKVTYLSRNLWLDSVYDNFGFIVELMLTEGQVCGGSINAVIMKTAKYIDRICSALLHLHTANEFIKAITTIQQLASNINTARKQNKSLNHKELHLLIISLRQFYLLQISAIPRHKTYTLTDIFDTTQPTSTPKDPTNFLILIYCSLVKTLA